MNSLKTHTSIFIFILLYASQAFAHPHHDGELLASLGLDHIFYGLIITLIAFFAYGRISK